MAAFPITAHAVCNALGPTTESVLAALYEGRSGLAPVGENDVRTLGLLPFELEPIASASGTDDTRQARLTAHIGLLVCEPMRAACRRWGAQRVGLIAGATRARAAATTLEVLQHVTGARGPAFAIAMGSSSSGKALASAERLLVIGVVDAVLVAGVQTICATTLHADEIHTPSSAAPCRPFSSLRQGTNLGEGAAVLLLERTADAEVALVGVAEVGDIHADRPPTEARGLQLALRRLLEEAGVAAARVGHINAHARATPLEDMAEAHAILRVFGGNVPVVATKGYTGHLLAAAAATEAVFAAEAIRRGWLPASLGCEPLDARLELPVVRERIDLESDYALSISLGCGHEGIAILLGASAS